MGMGTASTRALVVAALAGAIAVSDSCSPDHVFTQGPPDSLSVATTANLTGYIYAVNGVGTQEYHRTWYATDTAIVGDNNGYADPSSYRAVIAFTLPALPAGAAFFGAHLSITACNITNNPFNTLGIMVADHLVPTTAPDSATYDTTAITDSAGTILEDSSFAPQTVSLTTSVAADYAAGAATSMYRLRFGTMDTDGDDVSKYVVFCPPHLIITYVR